MPSTDKSGWHYVALAVVILGPLVVLPALAPIPQDIRYHAFVDTRTFIGIPNCFDVLSNFPFLLVGVPGLQFCLQRDVGPARVAWAILFASVGGVSIGSAYYHWDPTNGSLVWDRLPMTLGFMGLFVALLGEYVDDRLASKLLMPALLIGAGSVLYWHVTDDLRLYAWVQIMPLLTLPVMVILFRNDYTHKGLLLIALTWYGLAKLVEVNDTAIFQATQGILSGHTMKHLFAAAACYSILHMLKKRELNPFD